MNILVFPCGSEIGLEIYRSLEFTKDCTLIGGSSTSDHGLYVFPEVIPLPYVERPTFISKVNEAIKEHDIQYIFPAHDSVVLKLSQCNIKAEVITSEQKTCEVCRSKKATYDLFQGILPVPGNTDLFPMFLKPDVGQGSKGTVMVHTKTELNYHILKDPSLLVLEYLPGKEYTIDCFTDRHGKLLFAEGRERSRINNGISVNSKPVINPEFQRMAGVINSTLKFRGVWFFQVKERESGELVLMEIAPRIAGTMALYRNLGINLAELSLYDRMGKDVKILKNDFQIEIDRALQAKFKTDITYDRVYIDLDDTFIVRGELNLTALRFIYQAKAEGKRIILLTRHVGNIKGFLSEYAISCLLFDDIISVYESEKKSRYIEKCSIFVDDSFSERWEVFNALHIPVFGVDAIESLIK